MTRDCAPLLACVRLVQSLVSLRAENWLNGVLDTVAADGLTDDDLTEQLKRVKAYV